jgi:hypothetical protein
MVERAVAIKLTVRDQETVLAALRQIGKEGESAARKIEEAGRRGAPALRSVESGARGASGGIGELSRSVSAFGGPAAAMAGQLERIHGGLTRGHVAAGLFTLALGGVAAVLAGAAREWAEFERRQLRIEAVLRATGAASGKTRQEIVELVGSLERSTLFDDKQLLDAAAALLTFKAVAGDAFDRTLKVAADLAEVMGTDVKSAAMQLGKALEDPEQGLNALSRSGIGFTQAQKALIKSLLETGQEAKALDLILRAVEGQVGGAAVQAARGLAGEVDTLGKAWGDLEKELGKFVAESSVVIGAIRGIASALEWMNRQLAAPSVDDRIMDLRREIERREDLLNRRRVGGPFRTEQRELLERDRAELRRLEAEKDAAAETRVAESYDKVAAAAAAAAAAEERARERRAASARKGADGLAKEHARAVKEIERLEDEAARKAEEDRFRRIDLQSAQELDKFQDLLDRRIVKEEEYRRASDAIWRKNQAEKDEIARQATERWIDEQLRAHERAAKEALRPWQSFADDLAGIIARGLEDGFRSFDVGDLRRSAMRLAGGLANRQIVNPLLAGVGLAAPVPGAERSPLFDLGSSLSGLRLFGLPLVGGLHGTAGEQELVQRAAMAAQQPVPGGQGVVETALGGAATGFSLGSVLSGLGVGKPLGSQIGGSLGGMIGSIVGAAVPVIGPVLGNIAGSLLGSIFGGLFGNNRPSVGPVGSASFFVDETGFRLNGVGVDNGGTADSALQLARAFATALGRLARETGTAIAGWGNEGRQGFQAATYGGQFHLGFMTSEVSGSDAEDVIRRMLFNVIKDGGVLRDFGQDVAKAIANSTAADLEGLLADIEFARGLGEIVDGLAAARDQLKAVEVAARKAAREQVDAITAFVDKAVQLGFETEAIAGRDALVRQLLESGPEPEAVSESAKALAALAATLAVVRENASTLAVTEAEIAAAEAAARQELRRGFEDGIARQMLAIVDPVAAALAEFDRAAAARLEEARLLGADLVAVERLTMLQRQQVIEQAGAGARASLRRFHDDLTFGSLSGAAPLASLEGLRASFLAAAAQGDLGRIETLGRDLVTASRQAFASAAPFQSDLDLVRDVVGDALGAPDLSAQLAAIAAAIDGAGGEQIRELARIYHRLGDIANENVELREEIARLNARLQRLLAA